MATAMASVFATGAAARATGGDTAPPTAPYIVGPAVRRVRDGVSLGSLTDNGMYSAVYGVLTIKHAGPSTVTVKALDAAGNRSASSNADVITAYRC